MAHSVAKSPLRVEVFKLGCGCQGSTVRLAAEQNRVQNGGNKQDAVKRSEVRRPVTLESLVWQPPVKIDRRNQPPLPAK